MVPLPQYLSMNTYVRLLTYITREQVWGARHINLILIAQTQRENLVRGLVLLLFFSFSVFLFPLDARTISDVATAGPDTM